MRHEQLPGNARRRVHGSWRKQVDRDKFKFASVLRQNQTPAEWMLWDKLKHRQLGIRFKRQNIILGWIVDFYCGAAGIVVELDGSSHDDRQAEDARRDRVMEDAGLIVLRFTNQQVFAELDSVVSEIKDKLVGLGYTLPES